MLITTAISKKYAVAFLNIFKDISFSDIVNIGSCADLLTINKKFEIL